MAFELTEKLKQFIGDDGKTINLPVPIGTDTFFVSTTCGNFCCWQQELFDEKFPPKTDGRCGYHKPCHTIAWHIYKNPLGFNNMNHVLETWGERTFATVEEADARMKEIIEANRKTMRDMGFYVGLDGNGAIHKPEEEDTEA